MQKIPIIKPSLGHSFCHSIQKMWNNLPSDLLANIFSYLPPDSLARAKTTCRNWHVAAEFTSVTSTRHRYPPWFVAVPTRSRGLTSYYTHNPISSKWNLLPLDHTLYPIKPISTIYGLILSRITNKTSLQLVLTNPFTNQSKILPPLNVTRTNPAVGVVKTQKDSIFGFSFNIYVAGGMSEPAIGCGAEYQPTVESYDTCNDTWRIIGAMPVEFAVRLTVWTPNEGVFLNGALYWITSARAYSIMGFEIETKEWRELSVPMADRLEFAALVGRNGRLVAVGGVCGGDGCVWEFWDEGGGVWCLVERVPFGLGDKLLGDKRDWGSVKCVGVEGVVCLYRDLGSGFIVWREILNGEGKWEWEWIDGCGYFGGNRVQNCPIKGLLVYPILARSIF